MKLSRSMAARAFVGTVVVMMGTCSTALAAAGSPDPSFGSRGVAEITQRPSKHVDSGIGRAIALADGRVLVPEFQIEYRVRHGEPVDIARQKLRFIWLRTDGSTERTSAPIVLPPNLSDQRVLQAGDGRLLVVGMRYASGGRSAALYVHHLSPDGVPAAAPGGTAAAVTVPLSSIKPLGPKTDRTTTSSLVVAPNGRVFFVLRQTLVGKGKYPETAGYGPLVVAAVDPSIGLASAFAGGGLVIAPATNTRTTTAAATAVDADGRLLTLVRSTRTGIGGSIHRTHLTRYDGTGAVDTTFAGGPIDLDDGDVDTAYSGVPSLTILRGGDLLALLDKTTESGNSSTISIELRRFLPSGQPASTFGAGGRADIALLRSTAYGFGSMFTSGPRLDEPALVLEQPDGKLIVHVSRIPKASGVMEGRSGILRTTAAGAIDPTYGTNGFARLDASWGNAPWGMPGGIDTEGRLIGTVAFYSDSGTRGGVVRLLAGDRPAPPTSAQLRVDDRTCGASQARACFDPDGTVTLDGQVKAAGHGVAGADVLVHLTRPTDHETYDDAPEFPAVRTNSRGRFALRIPQGRMLPGRWVATARVIATTENQRVDSTRPVHLVIGPRTDIAVLKRVRRAQALAVAMDYVIDDSVRYDSKDLPSRQCSSPDACFRSSAGLLALVSKTAHPAPGKAGLLVKRPGTYTIVTRALTEEFRLEFVITATPDDTIYTCRGDAAARKRWCPGGTWDDVFEDAFVSAGVDGTPFGW